VICREIFTRTGLTASAGVSCNKFLAKVASDINKPNGITVVTPDEALPFIRALPVRKFFGVGRVTEKKMHKMGIQTGADLEKFSLQELTKTFGKAGAFFYEIVRGRDNRPVCRSRGRKSIGTETTLRHDINDLATMHEIFANQARQLGESLGKKELAARTLILKIRYRDFTTVTRSTTPACCFVNSEDIMDRVPVLLATTEAGKQQVRLLGLSLSNLCQVNSIQQRTMRQLLLPFDEV
jgi:DNA polymerase-4